MHPNMPNDYPVKISLVTPSYNQGQYLEETINSVLTQKYPNLEYIIIDGGSTDNSREIIKKYEKHLTYWISEKDLGQAHAITKGLTIATGEWFNWINSDDLLAESALEHLSEVVATNNDLLAIAGSTQNFKQGRVLKLRTTKAFAADALISQPLGSKARFHQPSIWLKTDLVRKTCINIELHCRFDLDLYIRYLLNNAGTVHYTNATLALFRLHETSKTCTQNEKFRLEFIRLLSDLHKINPSNQITSLCSKSKAALEWIGTLEAIEHSSDYRLAKIITLLKAAKNDPVAFHVPRTWRALKRILFYGGR